MEELEFVDGLIVKPPREKAPEFVKAQISIKVADLGKWLREKYKAGEEWVNVDVKVSKGGKWYAAVNTYKPKGGNSVADIESDIPFVSCALERDSTYRKLRWGKE